MNYKKENIILTDCELNELNLFLKGLEEVTNEKFEIKSKICNGKHSFINNIKRYLIYIFYPLKFVRNNEEYKYVIGWQQFFALFYVFYCKLFKIKKENVVIACNFTYKAKRGFLGKIYKRIMHYCINNKYLDYIHVPSTEYAKTCSIEFGIDEKKFIVTTFGIDDTYEKLKKATVEYNNYTLSIGRSNRDYDFLIEVWKDMPIENKLLIISDNYSYKKKLPSNIILRKDIIGDISLPYLMNCKLMIIPIADGKICSGDTVLLTAMSYAKPTIITEPSTLAEMYIINNQNGICLKKEKEIFKQEILKLLNDEEKLKVLGYNARESYLENFSRKNMGTCIGKVLKLGGNI